MAQYLDIEGLQLLWETTKDHLAKRDNDFNYKDDFIPFAGQICFVDTAREGLKAKIGDGITQWSELKYLDADEDQAGLIKMYKSLGDKEDGTITQKLISEEFHARYKTSVDEEHECLIFSL